MASYEKSKKKVVLKNDNMNEITSIKSFESTLSDWGKALGYYRFYPDKFIDMITPPDSKFRLYPFQRLYLRVMARYRISYIVATRGTSKSFLNVLMDYLKCIFYPNIKLSILAPQKAQASAITQANIEDIWHFLPVLRNEVKEFTFQKDYTRIKFYNGSQLDIIAVADGSRGLRRNGLSFEEIVDMEKHRDSIGSVILPLMANDRKGADQKVSPYEIHKQIKYITTASNRQSYGWETLRACMIDMAKMKDNTGDKDHDKSAFAIGNDYELPVLFDQLSYSYIKALEADPAMTRLAFEREYLSIWTGSSENSLVQIADLQACRKIKKPEFDRPEKVQDGTKYIIAVDVARSEKNESATTAIGILKIVPKANGGGKYHKYLVNLETYSKNMHFENQSDYIKSLVEKYSASMIVIDANGLGSGLVDFLIKPSRNGKYPPYSVVNDSDYDKNKTIDSIPIIFNVKSSTKETKASNIYNHFMVAIANHELNLLISEKDVTNNKKDNEELGYQLPPHIETTRFVEEVMNLTYSAEGNGTKIKQISNKVVKDRFSAVSYGLYYVYLEEQKNKNKRTAVTDMSAYGAIKSAKYKASAFS